MQDTHKMVLAISDWRAVKINPMMSTDHNEVKSIIPSLHQLCDDKATTATVLCVRSDSLRPVQRAASHDVFIT